MQNLSETKRILIIERQETWRETAVKALRGMGFLVKSLGHYDYSPSVGDIDGRKPDLVILGCASIKREEQDLIKSLLKDELHLLVLCTSLPWVDMRSLFLAGADDVADKPYEAARLIKIVENAFDSIKPRNSYEK